jgi:MFS family permease
MTQAALASAVRSPEFGRRYSSYALALLVLVGVFNIVDRAIIGLLLQPIGRDLELTDSQLGLFSGPAFGFFYALSQIPLAHLADRHRRARLIALALALWSVMTAIQGATVGFFTLLAARAGVGLGEAGSGPASHSMISDLFPPARRATALAIYSIVLPLGIAVGVQLAGWGREAFGWRATLQIIGLPGIALAVLVWTTLREPTRGYWEGAAESSHPPALLATFGLLLRTACFRQLLIGQSVAAFTFACLVFDPVYMERSHAFTGVQISRVLAAASTLGIGSTLLGGWIADRLSARGAAWPLRSVALFATSYAAVSVAVYLAPSGTSLVTSYLLGSCMPGSLGVVLAVAQNLAAPAMRARAAALLLSISTFVGGLGPLVTGIVSDALAPALGAESIRYALLSVVPLGWLWSGLHFWLGSRALPGAERAPA